MIHPARGNLSGNGIVHQLVKLEGAGGAHQHPRLQVNLSLAAEREHTGLQDGVRGKIRVDEVWDGRVLFERFHDEHNHVRVEIRFFTRSRSCQRRMPGMENFGHVAP